MGPTTFYKAVNNISSKGAQALSEALKVNTTLKTLSLCGNSNDEDEIKPDNGIKLTINTITGSGIGTEGVCALSEALKVNTALTSLDMECL